MITVINAEHILLNINSILLCLLQDFLGIDSLSLLIDVCDASGGVAQRHGERVAVILLGDEHSLESIDEARGVAVARFVDVSLEDAGIDGPGLLVIDAVEVLEISGLEDSQSSSI